MEKLVTEVGPLRVRDTGEQLPGSICVLSWPRNRLRLPEANGFAGERNGALQWRFEAYFCAPLIPLAGP